MTQVACFILTPDAQKADVITAVAHLTPSYTLGFSRKVAAADPAPTVSTAATHWRGHDAGVEQSIPVLWQAVATDGVLPEGFTMPEDATMTEQQIIDAMSGVKIVIGNDVVDSLAWAAAQMAPLGLADVPEPEF